MSEIFAYITYTIYLNLYINVMKNKHRVIQIYVNDCRYVNMLV